MTQFPVQRRNRTLLNRRKGSFRKFQTHSQAVHFRKNKRHKTHACIWTHTTGRSYAFLIPTSGLHYLSFLKQQPAWTEILFLVGSAPLQKPHLLASYFLCFWLHVLGAKIIVTMLRHLKGGKAHLKEKQNSLIKQPSEAFYAVKALVAQKVWKRKRTFWQHRVVSMHHSESGIKMSGSNNLPSSDVYISVHIYMQTHSCSLCKVYRIIRFGMQPKSWWEAPRRCSLESVSGHVRCYQRQLKCKQQSA